MKLYEDYLFDESEVLISEIEKDLAVDENNDGLFKYIPSFSSLDIIANVKQCDVISGVYYAFNNLCQVFDIELICGGNMVSFCKILSQVDNQQTLNESPILSRKKLLALNDYELSNVIISLLLDRDNWSKEIKYSTVLSDGKGNWVN